MKIIKYVSWFEGSVYKYWIKCALSNALLSGENVIYMKYKNEFLWIHFTIWMR